MLFIRNLDANELQTTFGFQHIAPKVVGQTLGEAVSVTSRDIAAYGQTQNANVSQAKNMHANALGFEQDPFFYGTGYYDEESGLQYMDARYYSPKLGMFMAQDSYNLMNRYQYANSNPIMLIDPHGHMPKWANGLILGGVLLAGLAMTAFSGAAAVMVDANFELSFTGSVGKELAMFSGMDASEEEGTVDAISNISEKKLGASKMGILGAAFTLSNILPTIVTYMEKSHGGATPGNIALSIGVPIAAMALGTVGMLGDNAWFQAADSALEGAAYPIMSKKNADMRSIWPEMLLGMLSGGISGQMGSYPARLALGDIENTSLTASSLWFGFRGIQMESVRQGIYGFGEMAMGHQTDLALMGKQILANGAIQIFEGFGLAYTMPWASVKNNTGMRLFLGNLGFNFAGAVMQVGSPLVNEVIQKW